MIEEVDVQIDIPRIQGTSDTSETISEDISRNEEKWTLKLEEFLQDIIKQCEQSSTLHAAARTTLKARSNAYSVLSISLPMFSASLNEISFIVNEYRVIPTLCMVVSGGMIAIKSLLRLDERCQKHLEYAGRFESLASSIKYTLSRSKAADVKVQDYLFQYKTLIAGAPPL